MAEQIKSFSITSLTIGATSDFHTKVNNLITTATPAALHVETQAARYATALTALSSIVNRPTAFVATADLKGADKVRDALIGVLVNVVRAHLTNTIAARKEAATRLDAELAPYKGIGKHEYSKQTAEVRGLLVTLALPENAAAITELSLDDEVDALQTANEAFEAAFLGKASEAAERKPQQDLDSKAVVGEANAAYQDIVQVVNAYAIVQPSDEVNQFIHDVNGLVAVYASIAGSSSTGGTAPEGGSGSEEEGGGSGDDERPGGL